VAYAVIAHYRCPELDTGPVREALLAMREHTRREPGNVTYEVHEEREAAPGGFILYERYTDRAAFDAHAASPHFAQYIVGVVRPRLTDRHVLFGEVVEGA
jgi:quinol monooxygenase YgiN